MAELDNDVLALLRRDRDEEDDELVHHPAGYTTKREPPPDIYGDRVGDRPAR
jgi:hypothetical protein